MYEFYLIFFLVVIWTIRNLPLINLDAALNLHFFITDLIEKIKQFERDLDNKE